MRRPSPGIPLAMAAMVAVSALITATGHPAAADRSAPPTAFSTQAQGARQLYVKECLVCHGDRGQGVPGSSEPLQGKLFEERNPTALEIFDVVRSGREPRLRALTDQQIYDTIAAELSAEGTTTADGSILSGSNAGTTSTGANALSSTVGRFFPPGH